MIFLFRKILSCLENSSYLRLWGDWFCDHNS